MRKKLEIILWIAVWVFGGSVFAENSEIAKACRYWDNRATQGMTEKAIGVMESLLKTEPNQYEALWRLGCYYQFLGDVSFGKLKLESYKKGLSYTEKAIKIKKQGVNGHLWRGLLSGSIILEGSNLSNFKLAHQMAGEFQFVLRLEPQNAQAHFALARYYDGAFGTGNDKKKALQEISLALKYDPDIQNGWMVLGGIAMKNNDLSTAKAAFAKFLDRTDPYKNYGTLIREENKVGEDYESLWHLGFFYQFMGQNSPNKKTKIALLEKGLAYLDHAERVNPRGVAGHLYRAILLGNIGLEKGILQSLRMVEPMVEELQTVVKLEPGNAMAHAMMGQIYWRAPGKPLSIGNKKKALDETALAVQYDPGSIAYWYNYGKIAVENGNYELARMAFTKVLSFFGGTASFKIQAQQELDKMSKR